jgi:hypothetical protein
MRNMIIVVAVVGILLASAGAALYLEGFTPSATMYSPGMIKMLAGKPTATNGII